MPRLTSRIVTRRQSRIGLRLSSIAMAFARTGPAWLDGVEVPANTPRYPSNSGIVGVMVEEGVNSLVTPTDWTTATLNLGSVTITGNDATFAPFQASDKLVFGAANSSIYKRNAMGASINGQTWTFSAPVYASAPGFVFVHINNSLSWGQGRIEKIAVVAGWNRVSVTQTFSAASTNIDCGIANFDVTGGAAAGGSGKGAAAVGAFTIWSPYGQLEQASSAVNRGPESLTFPLDGLVTPQQGALSVKAYFSGDVVATTPTACHCLFAATAGGTFSDLLSIQTDAGTGYPRLYFNGLSQTISHPVKLAQGWHTITITWDATIVRMYVDGTPAAGTISNPTLPAAWPTTGRVGALTATDIHWNNAIALLPLYARALSGGEAAQLAAGSPPPDFTAHLRFSNGQMEAIQGHPWGAPEYVALLDAAHAT